MNFLADLRYALRGLGRSPGFAAVAILTLALGIGANTAIFSAVDAVLLRALPYPHADRLVGVWESNPRTGGRVQVAGPNFGDWSRQTHDVFSGMAAFASTPLDLAGTGIAPSRVAVGIVGANFFSTLGANPELGRWFMADEHTKGHTGVVILADGIWRRQFGADPGVLGRMVLLDGAPKTIVGVMPPSFRFPEGSEIWTPVESYGVVVDSGSRTAHNYHVIARLAPGVSLDQARAMMDTVAARLRRQYGTTDGALVVPLRDQLAGSLGPALWILFGAVGLLLLIACANVANLLLARAGARQKEIALRAALGASRARIVVQLLTESIVLALLGGIAGVLLAAWGTRALGAFAVTVLPVYAHVRLDGAVLLFTLAIAILTGVIFGLAPAWQATRANPQAALQQGSARVAAGRGRLRAALVVAEVALSVVLLVGAGLLLRSLDRLLEVPLGFQPERVWTADLVLPSNAAAYAQPAGAVAYFDRLLARVRSLPGVRAAGVSSELPLDPGQTTNGAFQIADRPQVPENQLPYAEYREVTPDYFKTMGIALLRGRDFAAGDTTSAPLVVLVNQTAAHRYWPGQDPIGQRMRFLGFTPRGQPPWMQVVGVVGDNRTNLAEPPRAIAFVPLAQQPFGVMGGDAAVVVRSGLPGDALAGALRATIAGLDPAIPVQIGPMSARIADWTAPNRFRANLLGLFAALALVLAAVGLYGVLSFVVSERRKEIGIRMALGARPAQVLGAMIGEGVRLVIIGLVAGAIVAWFAGGLLAQFLFGVDAGDPATFAVVALVLLATAVAACWLPAHRAARVDPMEALRYE